jgi:hypothetical protein
MKWLLLIVIRAYWVVIPSRHRRVCLFRETCSRYVDRITRTEGLVAGLIALFRRYHQCRGGYRRVLSETAEGWALRLSDGTLVEARDLSLELRKVLET